MATARGNIPSDDDLRAMANPEIKRLADSLTDEADREQLSTALLRIHDALGRATGAHDENADTYRNRRTRAREVRFSELTDVDWIPSPALMGSIDALIEKAARTACTECEADVWALAELGTSQTHIAQTLRISQQAVSRALARARKAIYKYIDTDSLAYRVFRMECHRTAYFPPHKTPPLPDWIDPIRQRIEADPPVYTHIQADATNVLEVWRGGEPTGVTHSIARLKPRVRRATRRRQAPI